MKFGEENCRITDLIKAYHLLIHIEFVQVYPGGPLLLLCSIKKKSGLFVCESISQQKKVSLLFWLKHRSYQTVGLYNAIHRVHTCVSRRTFIIFV